jgi:hypothetical protein
MERSMSDEKATPEELRDLAAVLERRRGLILRTERRISNLRHAYSMVLLDLGGAARNRESVPEGESSAAATA